jgi:hypothetical protein
MENIWIVLAYFKQSNCFSYPDEHHQISKNQIIYSILIFTHINTLINTEIIRKVCLFLRWLEKWYYRGQDSSQFSLVFQFIVTWQNVITWCGNLEQCDLNKVQRLLLENGNQSLRFEVPKEFQSGLYRCLAYNAAGNVSHSGNIVITGTSIENVAIYLYILFLHTG